MVTVADPARSIVDGFIPTGWYPTAAQFSKDGTRIFILSGKGLTSQANPRGSHPGIPAWRPVQRRHAAGLAVDRRGARQGQAPGDDEDGLRDDAVQRVDHPRARRRAGRFANPGKVGDPSPIKHVFYVIRENRTYDQILGDLERGNGDPNLCLFGEQVTPNAHAIAREFVVLDNFYVDAEVSYDGHAYSTGAYATDFVEKIWPTTTAAAARAT